MDFGSFDELGDVISAANALDIAGERYSSKSEWASALAGTSDRSSKAFKAAQRRVQRWTTTEGKERYKPSKAGRQQMADILRRDEKAQEIALDQEDIEEIDVTLDAYVCISNDCRQRHFNFGLSTTQASKILAAKNANNPGLASKEFWKAYGIAEPASVENAELQIEARK